MADISIDGKIIEIILEKSPYENKYMADLGFRIEDDSDVVMSLKNSKDETRFFCVSKNWKIDFNRALVIGYEKFFDTIKGLYYNKKLHCEGYLIPISNIDYKTVFWYFSIIDTFGNIYNILIDVNSGDIII